MRTATALAVLALSIGCNKKKADAPPPPATGSADAAPPAADAAAPAPAVDAAQAATAPPPAAGGKAVCCESMGDLVHDTLELNEAVCKGEGLNGDVVEMSTCDVKGEVPIVAAGQAVTITAPGQYVGWKGHEDNQLVVCDIRLDAKAATVKCKGGGDKWKKTGKAPIAGAPITFTPNADGSAILANGTTTWKLAAEYTYEDVEMKEAAK